ncbi:hypothetical protein BXZ70DRAFT_960093 [Cristinia sonorae]|uniref:F-box domain-containing protein n=1 Tax=Cristinia sonorae TaxID=1940300 RepID=A0A8K0UF80_9AGAR|nr:hypothetical protein BXZ70DRAFT_960093 [Cristinia sonorae]
MMAEVRQVLPPNVLSKILQSHFRVASKRPAPDFLRSCLQVMGVCRQWRDSVLEMPDVWATVEFERGFPRQSIETMVKLLWLFVSRSKDAPLKISLPTLERRESLPPLRFVLSEIRRVQHLSLELTRDVHELFAKNREFFSAPLLTSLHITHHWNEGHLRSFMKQLLAPALQELQISGAAHSFRQTQPRWSRSLLPNSLERLIIQKGALSHRDATLVNVVNAIRHLQHLSYLELNDPFPPPNGELIHAIRPRTAELPNLAEIHLLDTHIATSASFIGHITIPATTRLSIVLNLQRRLAKEQSTEDQKLPVEQRRHIQALPLEQDKHLIRMLQTVLTPPTHTALNYPTVDTLVLGAQGASFHASGQEQRFPVPLRLPGRLTFLYARTEDQTEEYDVDIKSFKQLMRTVLLSSQLKIPVQNLTVLSLDFLPEHTESGPLVKLLEVLRNVTTLVLHRRAHSIPGWDWSYEAAIILLHVRYLPTLPPNPPVTKISLPNMKRLYLVNVEMNHPRKNSGRRRVVDGICTAFPAREEFGCKVEELFLVGCGDVDAAMVQRLRELVAVTWDGHEGPAYDPSSRE